jgi:hypothetical protein
LVLALSLSMLFIATSNCRCASDSGASDLGASDLAVREHLVQALLLLRHADDGPYPDQGDDGADE